MKLVASGTRQVLALVTGIITARYLGPYDKGTLSTLLYTAHAFLFYVCSLGLGDAAIILFSRRRYSLQDALSGSTIPLLISSLLGSAALWVVGILADWGAIAPSVIWVALGLITYVYLNFLTQLLIAEERFFASFSVSVITASVTVVLTWGLVVALDWGLTGAALASTAGLVVGLVVAGWHTRRAHLKLKFELNKPFLRSALSVGIGIQASFIVIVLAERFDQLLVYALAGPTDAGRYSVALTLGQLVAFAPSALSTATFPRTARLEFGSVEGFVAQLTRTGLAIALVSAGAVVVSVPFAIPLIWGPDYTEAIRPSMVLAVGGLFWSAQWLLARALSARGHQRMLLTSFAVTFIVTLLLDLLLIRSFGILGAAFASLGGSVAGCAVCLFSYQRLGNPLTNVLPRMSEFISLVGALRLNRKD